MLVWSNPGPFPQEISRPDQPQSPEAGERSLELYHCEPEQSAISQHLQWGIGKVIQQVWYTVAQIMARLCVRKKYLAMLLHMCANLILIQNFFMFPSQLCTVKKYFPMAIRATKSTLTVTAVKKSITTSVTAIIKSINKLLQQLQLL